MKTEKLLLGALGVLLGLSVSAADNKSQVDDEHAIPDHRTVRIASFSEIISPEVVPISGRALMKVAGKSSEGVDVGQYRLPFCRVLCYHLHR